jgi:hypothetical protein
MDPRLDQQSEEVVFLLLLLVWLSPWWVVTVWLAQRVRTGKNNIVW